MSKNANIASYLHIRPDLEHIWPSRIYMHIMRIKETSVVPYLNTLFTKVRNQRLRSSMTTKNYLFEQFFKKPYLYLKYFRHHLFFKKTALYSIENLSLYM